MPKKRETIATWGRKKGGEKGKGTVKWSENLEPRENAQGYVYFVSTSAGGLKEFGKNKNCENEELKLKRRKAGPIFRRLLRAFSEKKKRAL